MSLTSTSAGALADPGAAGFADRPAAAALADEMLAFVCAQLQAVSAAYLPEFRLPATFAGHVVGADTRVELAHLLSLLHRLGLGALAGAALGDVIGRVVRPLAGQALGPFSVYRAAECLGQFGSFSGNRLLVDWTPAERAGLAAALALPSAPGGPEDRGAPRNFLAVRARCELARAELGLISPEDASLRALVGRVQEMLAEGEDGFFDDCPQGTGRYDIYSADVYLFCEPLAAMLGPVWRRGAEAGLRLAERAVSSDGYALPWGRSSGALAACLTIELGGLTLRHGLRPDPARWLTLMQVAFQSLRGWFAGTGLTSAHQHRAQDGYRGPHRRLQMTFDCLGKIAWAALALRGAPVPAEAEPAAPERAFPSQDEVVWLDRGRRAAVWCYRHRGLEFVLPLVGSTRGDYLPSPRCPGLFEVPVEVDLPCGVPLVIQKGARYVAGALPEEVEKVSDGIVLRYRGFPRASQDRVGQGSARFPGARTVRYAVAGRRLRVQESLRFDEPPDGVSLQIAEAAGRPLAVRFQSDLPHQVFTVDTSGVKEYRSFWSELPKVHQIDLQPAREVTFSYEVTPQLRVLSDARRHPYHQLIYGPLEGRVCLGETSTRELRSQKAAELDRQLRGWDIFHLHWPEWLLGPDLDSHRAFVAALQRAGVKIVWTQHNLQPHDKDPRFDGVHRCWAAAAHGLIHHSRWGMERSRARYQFRPEAQHRLIPHPHFGPLATIDGSSSRREDELALGLAPGRLRLGIFGAPRKEKLVGMAIAAFVAALRAAAREDMELVVLSLAPGEAVPSHPRVVARPYRYLPRPEYDRWLRVTDLLILPYRAEGMLTTGAVADAIAHGLPALVSNWPFLAEALGDAAIPYGASFEELVRAIASIDREALVRPAQACRGRRESCAPGLVAEKTLELLESVTSS